jgi:proline iminopeptidase
MEKDEFTNGIFKLPVGNGHKLHVVDWGNNNAKTPFIFLHGGPGSSVKDKYKKAFDPKLHRVIFFDQRGCGGSTPAGSLKNNTTQDLIEDISKIAKELNIAEFYLSGQSWGSTLALAYAVAHPENVKGLVIGGVFTGSRDEINWVDKGYFKTFYPEAWQAYVDRTPKEFQDNPSSYHFDKLLNGKPNEQKVSGYAYECLESGIVKLDDRFNPDDYEEYDPSSTRIEAHYLANDCFMLDRHILDNAAQLKMPIHIIQGRYDMVCPPATAYELHSKLPNGRIYWAISGHVPEHETENIQRAILASL